MYVEYFSKEVKKVAIEPTEKQIKYLNEFKDNLFDGIEYYKDLYPKMIKESKEYRDNALSEIEAFRRNLVLFTAKLLRCLRRAPPPKRGKSRSMQNVARFSRDKPTNCLREVLPIMSRTNLLSSQG